MMRKNICIIGPLGAGKSTCISLIATGNYQCISSGKLIRSAGLDVSKGDLVNDQIVVSLIYTEMSKTTKSIIHDGFPRTVEQGLEFLRLGEHIDSMIYLSIPYKVLYDRVSSRLICSNPSCQATYNRKNLISINGKYYCKYCHSLLTVRPDDNPEAIKKRYTIFQNNLKDIISFCEIYNIPFIEIDAQKSPVDISKQILLCLN